MKTIIKTTVGISLLIVTLLSCNKKEKNSEVDNKNNGIIKEVVVQPKVKEQEKIKDEVLNILLSFQTNESDLFQIKYNALNAEKTKIKYLDVKSKDINSPIEFKAEFNLEEIGNPKSIFLILGHKNVKKIKFDKIKLATRDTIIEVNKDNLLEYFILNQHVSYSNENNLLETHKYKGKHLPILTLNKRSLEILDIN